MDELKETVKQKEKKWFPPFKGKRFELFGWTFIVNYHRTKPKRVDILNPEYLFAKYEEVSNWSGQPTVAELSNNERTGRALITLVNGKYPRRGNIFEDGKIVDNIPPRKIISQ